MKKILFTFLFFTASAFVIAQQVPRSMVALEIGTGTWCGYCPGAAMGADDLLSNGKFVAVIENHNGDGFANTYSNARNSYYNITGYPTAVFDGLLKVVGGSHTQSMYTQYLPKYNQRMAILANLTLSMDVAHDGLNYTATITINKVNTITATDLKLHFFVTQSNILFNWQGQTHLEHVNRLMVPNQNGTGISFDSGDTQIVTLNFNMAPTWPLEDCEFIALVQSQGAKEVYNCIKQGSINLTPDFTANLTQVEPGGTVTFTNATVGGYIGVPDNTYLWSFPGGEPSTSTLENPVVTYSECGFHDVSLTVERGGQTETITKSQFITVGPPVAITALPNDTVCNNQSITLDATTENVISYLWMPGGQTTPIITVDTNGIGGGAHTYTVTATGSDGCIIEKSITVYFDNCGTAFTLNGTITYPNAAGTPLSDIYLALKNSSGTIVGTTSTNSQGGYSFSDVYIGDYTLEASTTKPWGGVTAADVLLFKKHIANIAYLSGIFLASGDVNGSGDLTAADVLVIKKRVANITNSFPVGDWLFNNTPITISGGNVTQNFNGLCFGDANASYTPANKNSHFYGQMKSSDGSFTIGTIFNATAGQITVPVYAEQIDNMGSFQFTIEYDPALMTFNSISDWYAGIDGVTSGEPVPGKLTFVWAADTEGITMEENLFFNLHFTWNGLQSTSPVNWTDIPTQREIGDWNGNIFVPTYNNGSVTGAPVGMNENNAQFLTAFPNPAFDKIEITSDFNIQQIELISYTGKVLKNLNPVSSKIIRMDVADLPSGIYFIKATTSQGNRTTKITIAH